MLLEALLCAKLPSWSYPLRLGALVNTPRTKPPEMKRHFKPMVFTFARAVIKRAGTLEVVHAELKAEAFPLFIRVRQLARGR